MKLILIIKYKNNSKILFKIFFRIKSNFKNIFLKDLLKF